MAPFKDFEAQNAEQWDLESAISTTTNTTQLTQGVIRDLPATTGILIDLDPEVQHDVVPPQTPRTSSNPKEPSRQVPSSASQSRQTISNSAGAFTRQPSTSPRSNAHRNASSSQSYGDDESSGTMSYSTQINLTASPRGRGSGRGSGRGNGRHAGGRGFLGSRGLPRNPNGFQSSGRESPFCEPINAQYGPGSPHGPNRERPISDQRNLQYNPRYPRGGRNYISRRSFSAGQSLSKGKASWAEPAPLITTARAKHLEKTAKENAEMMKYLNQAEDEGEHPRNGFYLWTNYSKQPVDFFGDRLEKLDIIRTTCQVWIKWHEATNCLKISSKSTNPGNESIEAAVEAIRNVYKEANARDVRAIPLNLVHPPAVSAISSIVRPRSVYRNPDVASDFELAGDRLSSKEEAAWEKDVRRKKTNDNFDRFERHLKQYLMEIAPLKGWMRMRVHFGHLEINVFRDEFADGRFSFEQFDAMLQKPRTRTKLNKHLGNALLAVNAAETISQSPEIFYSVNGKYRNMADIRWKDTEILFARVPDISHTVRVEAEIEHMYELPGYELQPGITKAYNSDERNIIIEVRAIDIEKNLDWSLDVISDNCLKELPAGVEKIINDSISVKTKIATDILGLEYPRVTPRAIGGIEIESTVLRSVIAYQLRDSGYIVEISVYRTWKGTDTRGNPSLNIAVAMFHQEWDKQMEPIDHTLEVREWEEDLSTFFAKHDPNISGLEYFVNEVRKVQGILVDVRASLP